jgi:hypothetical protein
MLSILYVIAVVLIALWLIGFVANIAGGLIHILLVVAIIIIAYNLLTGRTRV